MEARQQPMMAQPVVQQGAAAPSLTLSARSAVEQPRAEMVTPQALQNATLQAPQAEARKKAPTLFEKMTSRFAGQGKTAMPTRDAVPAGVQRPEPRVTRPEAPVQPSLNLDPTERLTQIRHEEETLDIPAFLRRQAN
jgi:cell division protein FtsZ